MKSLIVFVNSTGEEMAFEMMNDECLDQPSTFYLRLLDYFDFVVLSAPNPLEC